MARAIVNKPNRTRAEDPLKDTALLALRRVMDPLVDLMFDAGITVKEFGLLVRDCAVRAAAARIAQESGRKSNSRVAILTGLSRAEIARVLRTAEPAYGSRGQYHPARRVLAAWHDDRRFLAVSGDPAVLRVFGKRKSFERLVALHSGGIPVRAMLDQLVQIGAAEILPGQMVKVKSRIPVFRGMTVGAISNIGERTADLLGTLRNNLRTKSMPLFEGTAFHGELDVGAVPLVRRQIAEQGSVFIDSATSLLSRSRSSRKLSSLKQTPQCRVGVTVYYFEDEIATASGRRPPGDTGPRKNLQRQIVKLKRSEKQATMGRIRRRS